MVIRVIGGRGQRQRYKEKRETCETTLHDWKRLPPPPMALQWSTS
jgi:hypothetical protein